MSLSADLSLLQRSQGAEREAVLVTLEKQLMCPICLEIFNKPVVILPCQHNLCRKCANELYQPSLFQARTTMMVNSGRFRCPSCRHEVVLDRHGVYGLQRNTLVENIIDVYKKEVSNTTSPLLPPQPPSQLTCSDHEGEKVNIYCLTCQVPTCSLCKVFGSHQSCQVAPLTDIYQQQKDNLSEGIASLVAYSDRVQALIHDIEDTCRCIEENSKTQKQDMCDKFNQILSILETRRKGHQQLNTTEYRSLLQKSIKAAEKKSNLRILTVMTQQISSEQEEKAGYAQLLVCCYGDSIEANRKLVQNAASSMEELDMAAFVQTSGELITKVIAATSSCPSEMLKPGYESLSHKRYDFSKQETALKSMNFTKVLEDVPDAPELDPVQEHQEVSVQNPDGVVEPVKEPVPAVLCPPVEPVGHEEAPVPSAPAVETSSVESAGGFIQLEADDADSDAERQENTEVERKKDEVQKEDNSYEHQEEMSTQQAVTLIFYLLALLVILQKFWDCFGCFICI